MRSYESVGITQKAMSALSRVNPSTISRFVSTNKIEPLVATVKNAKYGIQETRLILGEFLKKATVPKKKVQSFYNFKGGTGKTSLCFQAASHLALYGFQVLVVDADPQGHLSTILGFDHAETLLTLYDVVVENMNVQSAIQSVFPGLDCLPANLSLTRISLPLDQMPKREEVLKRIFSPLKEKYDFIIFDANPTISTLNRNIIVFSDVLNIVCETQPLSLHGLKILMEDLQKFCSIMQMALPEIFIVPNKYEDRAGSSAEAMAVLRKYYQNYLKPDFAVRKSEDINTASKNGLPVSFFAKTTSNASEDIRDLVNEIMERAAKVVQVRPAA